MRKNNSYTPSNMGVFTFQDSDNSSQIRSLIIDGIPWFVGSDIAKALGYKNPNKAVRDHCNLEGRTNRSTPTKSGIQGLVYINEPNLYRLVIKSSLPAAKSFEKWVFEVVLPSIRKTGKYGHSVGMPDYFKRCVLNVMNVDDGYFSVIHELAMILHAKLESLGYVIPDEAINGKGIRPDVSVGIGFSNYLKDYYPDLVVKRKKYPHKFDPNGVAVKAWQYPNGVTELFREYVMHVWIPEKASDYFDKRCPDVLNYLPKILPIRTNS